MKRGLKLLLFFPLLSACVFSEKEAPVEKAEMVSVVFNGKTIPPTKVPMGVSGSVEYVLTFTKNLDINDFNTALVTCNGASLSAFDFSAEGKELHIKSNTALPFFKKISINLYAGKNFGVNLSENYKLSFVT